jgi:hypothetical protein
LTTDNPIVSAALERLERAWPAALWVRELTPPGAGEANREALRDALLRSYAANLIQLHVHPPELAASPGELPEASPLARHKALSGELVTNLRHTSVRIDDELGRRLVSLLDGSRDRAMLGTELRAWLEETGHDAPPDLDEGLERSLNGLARLGLLSA